MPRDLAPSDESRISMISTETSSGASGGDGPTTRKRKKIIFLTSSEYGQANVILAVAYEMLLVQQHEIHIASFAPLNGRIKSLNELVLDNYVPAIFHTVFGPSALEALVSKNEFIGESALRKRRRRKRKSTHRCNKVHTLPASGERLIRTGSPFQF